MKHSDIISIITFLQKLQKNSLDTEFEMFFQKLLNDVSAILEENLARIKMKLRSTCEKYYQVKPYFK